MHTYISMHTQNTRIHLQRKPVMIDDNDYDDVLLTLLSLLQHKSDICVIATAKPNIYIPMHTQNTRINLQRKPAMIDDNDDDDDAEDDIDDDEDDDDADDEDYMMMMLMTKIMKLPEKMLPMPQLPGCT